jgi:hypothetical protein
MLDLCGQLVMENDKKVIYVSCLISPEPVSLVPILPLSSTGNRQQTYILTARLVVSNPRAGLETGIAQSSLADVLFLEVGRKAEIDWLE